MKTIRLTLNRTFRKIERDINASNVDELDFRDYLNSPKSDLTWIDLHSKRVVIILGDAGMGKTWEFQDEASRLRSQGTPAFFIPLNAASTSEEYELSLNADWEEYQTWLNSGRAAHFFLDAVDEARLTSPTALKLAVSCIAKKLKHNLSRVSFVISSRIPDWNIPEVREVFEQRLVGPLNATTKNNGDLGQVDDERAILVPSQARTEIVAEAFRIQPLSIADAMRIADAHGASPVSQFWEDVKQGDYEYMARSPRDLEWMALRWKATHTLGTHIELLNDFVANRLRERNQCYIDAGNILSSNELRAAAERLAAASVFSGITAISMPTVPAQLAAIDPQSVLADLDSNTQLRVLGTALFDDATYGRFKFQHSTREFLAAYWVAALCDDGVPIRVVLKLFYDEPYGLPVLINSRRSTFCWLASLNARVREFLVDKFPEMLMFEGDPSCWSTDDVAEAFRGYVSRLNSGFRPNWWNEIGELRRIANRLPVSALVDCLKEFPTSPNVTPHILKLVKHARISQCAEAVFRIYKNPKSKPRFKRIALAALSGIATATQRAAVRADLLANRLISNELVAEALEVVDLGTLSTVELTQIFKATKAESEFGGAMTIEISRCVLPNAGLESALKILNSLRFSLSLADASLAEAIERDELPDHDRWKVHLLPECLCRVVSQIEDDVNVCPEDLLEAAQFVESLLHTQFARDEDFAALRKAIEQKPLFRHRLLVRLIGSSEKGVNRFLWGRGLIELSDCESAWLIKVANDSSNSEACRLRFAELALSIAFSRQRPSQRRATVKMLTAPGSIDILSRVAATAAAESSAIVRAKGLIEFKREERARKALERANVAKTNEDLLKRATSILDGADFGAIRWLVSKYGDSTGGSRFSNVNFDAVTYAHGSQLARILSRGLVAYWTKCTPPSVIDYPNNEVPWVGLVGLAGFNRALEEGLDIANMPREDAERAVKLSVWELNAVPVWLAALASQFNGVVCEVLRPWFVHELESIISEEAYPRTVELVLKAEEEIRTPLLALASAMLVENRICSGRIQLQICRAAAECGELSASALGRLAIDRLDDESQETTEQCQRDWLGLWFEVDPRRAWKWVADRMADRRINQSELVTFVARAMEGKKWAETLKSDERDFKLLTDIYDVLGRYREVPIPEKDMDGFWHPIQRLQESIPVLISRQPGALSNEVLKSLMRKAKAGTPEADWFYNLLVDHSVAEVERHASVSPSACMEFGEVFCREPNSERELFQQVKARLEEIKASLESGPFSDRLFFAAGLPEKHIQLWLAARLNDTPRRKFKARFSVHREPQVDADKRTDIEVSTKNFKVCIEIKPVDKKRYSVAELVETLEAQLVGRYLKGGQNSKHGILIVFRLEVKRWRVDNRLIDYADMLKSVASHIPRVLSTNPVVDGLEVMGIDCVE